MLYIFNQITPLRHVLPDSFNCRRNLPERVTDVADECAGEETCDDPPKGVTNAQGDETANERAEETSLGDF